MISKFEMEKFIKNREHLYNALQANMYFLPPLKNQFTTHKFLKEVFQETCYCPRVKDVTFLPCMHPPTAADLAEVIAGTIESH